MEDKRAETRRRACYYSGFSIPPLVGIIIAINGVFYRGDVTTAITYQFDMSSAGVYGLRIRGGVGDPCFLPSSSPLVRSAGLSSTCRDFVGFLRPCCFSRFSKSDSEDGLLVSFVMVPPEMRTSA